MPDWVEAAYAGSYRNRRAKGSLLFLEFVTLARDKPYVRTQECPCSKPGVIPRTEPRIVHRRVAPCTVHGALHVAWGRDSRHRGHKKRTAGDPAAPHVLRQDASGHAALGISSPISSKFIPSSPITPWVL